MNSMEELIKISDKIPSAVLEEMHKRIGDWLANGGKKDDPYIEQQLRYAKRFVR